MITEDHEYKKGFKGKNKKMQKIILYDLKCRSIDIADTLKISREYRS